jgi:hypothetical protein
MRPRAGDYGTALVERRNAALSAGPKAQGSSPRGQTSPFFRSLPAELRHKILLDSVEPVTIDAIVLEDSTEYGLFAALDVVRPFDRTPLYAVSKEARELALCYFGEPSASSFPFNTRRDSLRLDLLGLHPRPAAGGKRTHPACSHIPPPPVFTFEEPNSFGETSLPVPAHVIARIHRVTLRVGHDYSEPQLDEECTQLYLGGTNLASRNLVRMLADLLPNLEHLTIEFLRADDCLFSSAGARRYADYGPNRGDRLFETKVLDMLDMLDALEGTEGRCPFPRLKSLRVVVCGEYCSYAGRVWAFLCCNVANYVPVREGETVSLVGREQWWTGEVGWAKAENHGEFGTVVVEEW